MKDLSTAKVGDHVKVDTFRGSSLQKIVEITKGGNIRLDKSGNTLFTKNGNVRGSGTWNTTKAYLLDENEVMHYKKLIFTDKISQKIKGCRLTYEQAVEIARIMCWEEE